MMRRNVSIGRGRPPVFVGCLVVILAFVLRPAPVHAQAIVRDEPALHTSADGGPTVSVNGNVDHSDDPTVRQPPSQNVVAPGFPAATLESGNGYVDLTGGRGAVVAAVRASWRPIFYLNLGTAYNDNIFISSNKVGDSITTIEPGIILALGDFRAVLPHLGTFEHLYDVPTDTATDARFVYLDYHPSIYLFGDHSSQNSVDESVNLLGGYNFGKLTVGLQAEYQKLSIEDFDAGDRVDRDIYTLNLSSVYQYSDKTSFELGLNFNDREYQAPYTSSTEVTSQNYLNYAYGPKTQVSVGFAAGYLDYHSLINQTYEQALVRLSSVQFVKLDFTFNGGVEFRQNLGAGDSVDGVFNAALNYRPFDGTTLSFVASRATEPSATDNDEVTYTQVGFSLEQRFLSRIYMTLRGTYNNADYSSVTTGQTIPRTDNYEEVYLSFGADVTQFASVQVSYLLHNSTSTLPGRTFNENIGGVTVRLTY